MRLIGWSLAGQTTLFVLYLASSGCSSKLAGCSNVDLQREAGRSENEIAQTLGVSRSEVAKCPVVANPQANSGG